MLDLSKVCRLSLLSLLTLSFVVGCSSVQGHWTLREHQPCLEKSDYKMVKASFFCNDSFQALISQDDQTLKMKGMYDYNPCSGDLILQSGDKVLCYKVRCLSDKRMCLDMCNPDDFVTTAVMVRHYKCPYRASCAPCDPCRPACTCPCLCKSCP